MVRKVSRPVRESGYYPAGAEFDPNAPYNQPEEEEEFDDDDEYMQDYVDEMRFESMREERMLNDL